MFQPIYPKKNPKLLLLSSFSKIVDEADYLYGFSKAIGPPEDMLGKSIPASPRIVEAIKQNAIHKDVPYEVRICHHLEAYHALRAPEAFPVDSCKRIKEDLSKFKSNIKKESMDMETAVLFETAMLFNKHAAIILQTVNKERISDPYHDLNGLEEITRIEKSFFDILISSFKTLIPKEAIPEL